MRHLDDMLKDREAAFLGRFRHNLAESQLNEQLRTCPIEHEWIDENTMIVALCDVESVNDFELRTLHAAFEVECHCTVTPMHLNRLRVAFQCKLNEKPR